jgi:hypothetical protein
MSANTAVATDLPDIKAGLWNITTEGDASQTIKQCVDKDTTKALFEAGTKALGNQCSAIDIKKQGNSYTSIVNCKMMGSTFKAVSTIEGDFESQYKSTTKTTIDPPLMGQAGKTEVAIAKYIGPCEEGMEPGDVVLGSGQKMNALKMMENMPDLGALQKGIQGGNGQKMPSAEQIQKMMEAAQQMQQNQN